MNSRLDLKPGVMLGPYRIVRHIGRGGMGEVYEAFEEKLNRRIAIKVILEEHTGNTENIQRFETEGRALARVSHPSIVAIFSLDTYEGSPYLAMEYIEGQTLGAYLKQRVFSAKDALPLFKQLLQGVQALHKNNIVHRDLKPNNIIYQPDHSVKIVDFGVAKIFQDSSTEITDSGVVIGSANYISPEGVRGEPASFQSDIWALGVIFYEMLFGQPPFVGRRRREVFEAIKNKDVSLPLLGKMWVPRPVQSIILKMTRRSRDQRYDSVDQILEDVERFIQQSLFKSNRTSLPDPTPNLSKAVKNEERVYKKLIDNGYDKYHAKMIISLALAEQAKIEKEHFISADLTVGTDEQMQITLSTTAIHSAIEKVKNTEESLKDSQSHLSTPRKRKKRSQYGWLKPFVASAVVIAALVGLLTHKKSTNQGPGLKSVYLKRPKIIDKKHQLYLKYSQTKPASLLNPPVLTWAQSQRADGYRIQISATKDFSQLQVDENLKGHHFTWTQPKPGEYFWRVQAVQGTASKSQFSKPGVLKIFVPAPRLKESYNLKGRGLFSTRLEPVPFAQSYRILVSSRKDFKKISADIISRSEYIKLQLSRTGTHYFKVVPLGKNYQSLGAYSKPAAIYYRKSKTAKKTRTSKPRPQRKPARH